MCIKVIFSIRRIGNMYLRYFLSWLFSGGRASFFIFFWLHTLLYHIPFAKKHPSCFCPQRGISARFPACLLLPSQGCGWPADFMPALRGECACLCLADTSFRSPSLHVLLFHYCFWAKSQSFSAAKIVCGRERLDKP